VSVRRRLLSDAPMIDRAVGLCAIGELAEMRAIKFFAGNMPGETHVITLYAPFGRHGHAASPLRTAAGPQIV